MYHFLFVPLTLGLSILVAMMETVYVMTRRKIWRDMTKFWGLLFGINFALGVATGLTMEFQFGMNWAYYSHYVGDVFGAPLAIEGLMAFFLEATFVGLFFFGWDKLSALTHCVVTWLMALGTNFSALWILIANGWMQNPVGSAFNPDTMRMEVTDFAAVLLNPVAQAKFVHTVSAGYVCGAVFVLGVSAFYILRGRHLELAKRSFAIAAAFGLASALSVVVLGDESGYAITDHQKMKLAAMEAMWHTEPAPAAFTAVGIPDLESRTTRDLPEPAARIQARVIEFADMLTLGLLPANLKLTRDQVTLLQSDNVVSEAAKAEGRSIEALGIQPTAVEAVVPGYLWRFRKAGQFAQGRGTEAEAGVPDMLAPESESTKSTHRPARASGPSLGPDAARPSQMGARWGTRG